jgi:two-component system chemotaxis response regulator CheB
MPPSFIASFAKRLNDNCALKVVEGAFGNARGAKHLLRGARRDASVPAPQDDGRDRDSHSDHAGDAVRALGGRHDGVRSKIYGADTVGVLMTGIGDDGADQMVAIRQAGGHTIAESEQTAVVYGMPREAIERGGACVVAPSHQVAGEILKTVRRTIQ